MSRQTGRKIGFFMALAMLVGSVVGIGIFFKSHGVLRSNDQNGIGTLVAWILGGLLSVAAAVSFSEIGTMKTKNVQGLAAWAEKVGGKKLGYFTRFNYSFFYFGLLTAVLGVFGSEMLFNMIATFGSSEMSDFPMYAHIILGLAFSVGFFTLNYFSLRSGGYVQIVTTVLKWIPLVIVAFAGIILATTNHAPSGTRGHSAFTNGTDFKFTGMLAALPAVLFAFDAFLNASTMKDKMKEPKKLPMVVLVGMISILVLYLLIALSAILHGTGMVSGLPFGPKAYGLGIFDQIFDKSTGEAMGKFVIVFLLISTLGVINGMSAAAVATHEQAITTNTIFGAKSLRAKFGDKKVVFGYGVALLFFWTLVFGIPASVLNSDSIVDGVSNFPTLFMFGLYGLVILLYTLKRDSFKTTKMNKYLFKSFAWTAVIGIFFVVDYMVIYGFFIDAINDPSSTTHWGLFAGDHELSSNVNFPTTSDLDFGIYMSKLQSLFVFFSLLAVFLATPFLNKFLTKKFESNEVEIDTDSLDIVTDAPETVVSDGIKHVSKVSKKETKTQTKSS